MGPQQTPLAVRHGDPEEGEVVEGAATATTASNSADLASSSDHGREGPHRPPRGSDDFFKGEALDSRKPAPSDGRTNGNACTAGEE